MKDLRQYIDKVAESGELRTIEGANCEWEIGALTHSVAKGHSPPALLFDKIDGYKPGYRVFALPYLTLRRRTMVFDCQAEGTEIGFVRQLRDRLRKPVELIPPVQLTQGKVTENIHVGDQVDLLEFPTPKWQPEDGGRYIGTGDVVVMRDPDAGWVNVAPYRVQVYDKSTAIIFIDPSRQGNIIRGKYWAKGQSCPAAVVCGGDPLLVTIGGLPIPWGTSEYDYTGWWQKEPVEVIKGPVTGLPIPAHAEIVLEGEIPPPDTETRIEGPFSEFSGHYAPARPEPVFRVKAVLHRNDPVIFGVQPFLGPGVVCAAGQALYAARVWARLDELVAGIEGVWIPPEFGSRAMVVSLRQQYAGHAKQAAISALGIRGFLQKYIIVVDDDVDPSNLNEVLFAIGYRAEPDEVDIIREWKTAMIDPRLPPEKVAVGDATSSVAIILACKPYRWMKSFPRTVKADLTLEKQVRAKFGELAV